MMPEGPEIYRRAQHLHQNVNGSQVQAVSGPWATHVPRLAAAGSAKITNIFSHGKALFFVIGENVLEVHFGMTGKFSLTAAPVRSKEVKLVLVLGGRFLTLEDSRGIGYIREVRTARIADHIRSHFGPNVCIDDEKTILQVLRNCNTKRKVCVVLMDQKVLAGIGNYLRAEILYDAQVHPYTKFCDLNVDEQCRLAHSIVKVCRGFTDGIRAKQVYGKSRCRGLEVITEKVSGRVLHWVPSFYEQ